MRQMHNAGTGEDFSEYPWLQDDGVLDPIRKVGSPEAIDTAASFVLPLKLKEILDRSTSLQTTVACQDYE